MRRRTSDQRNRTLKLQLVHQTIRIERPSCKSKSDNLLQSYATAAQCKKKSKRNNTKPPFAQCLMHKCESFEKYQHHNNHKEMLRILNLLYQRDPYQKVNFLIFFCNVLICLLKGFHMFPISVFTPWLPATYLCSVFSVAPFQPSADWIKRSASQTIGDIHQSQYCA